MFHSVALRELPMTSALLADCWEGAPRYRGLVPRPLADPRSIEEQARLLDARRYDRQGLADTLREQNQAYGAGPEALAATERIRDPATLVVTGGQQAGLFGGPLYTLHKALTISSLAGRLEKRLGRPVVPVFWIASEDGDLAEVDRASLLDRDGNLHQLRLPGDEEARIPVSRVRFGEEIRTLLNTVAQLLPETGNTEELFSELRSSYAPGRSYPQAFGGWMASLFRGRSLVLLDPSDSRLKRMATGLFRREILEASPVSAAVREQTTRLVKAGYPAQIELRDGLLTLFYQDPSRESLAAWAEGWELKDKHQQFRSSELADLAEREPEKLSPNAVLRPLFQDTILPTLAVVLGPSELAYWTQLPLAYERFGIPMPVLVPRASLTVIEARAQKLLAKLEVSLPDLLRHGEAVIDALVRRQIPPESFQRLSAARQQVAEVWGPIIADAARLDVTLLPTASLASARALRQLDWLEKKLVQAARRRNELLRSQVHRLVSALAPRGGLQERTLTALPFLARAGRGLLDQLEAALDPFAPEHRAVVLEP